MKTSKMLRLFAVLFALSLFAAACGSDEATEDADQGGDSTDTTDSTTTPTTTGG